MEADSPAPVKPSGNNSTSHHLNSQETPELKLPRQLDLYLIYKTCEIINIVVLVTKFGGNLLYSNRELIHHSTCKDRELELNWAYRRDCVNYFNVSLLLITIYFLNVCLYDRICLRLAFTVTK